MNLVINLFKNLFNLAPMVSKVEVPIVKPPVFTDFSHRKASNGEKFQLRNGKNFTLISLNHKIPDDLSPRVLIHIEGEDVPRQYYDDGIWDELELSGYDLVMVQ